MILLSGKNITMSFGLALSMRVFLLVSIAVAFAFATVMPPPRPWPEQGERDRTLGQSCNVTQDCQTAFAVCTNKSGDDQRTCQCLDGQKSSSDKQSCPPRERHCPTGDPTLSISRKPIDCTRKYDPSTNKQTSNCPEGSYCFAELMNNVGHCCPKPKHLCPIGEPATDRTCGSPIPIDVKAASPTTKSCDYNTQSCFSMAAGLESVCCPLPCGQGDVYKSGKCYRPKRVGEACQIPEQCSGSYGATCTKGKCVCKEGWINRNGYCQEIICPGPIGGARLPPKKQNGKFVDCKSDSGCSDKQYCNSDFSICCPVPKAVCYACNGDYVEQTTPIPCANPKDCPGGDYNCNWWYSHLVEPRDGSGKKTSKPPVVGQSNFCCPPIQDCPPPRPIPLRA